jgi:hypothetical protein
LSDDVLDIFEKGHLLELIGEGNVYPTQAVAIESIYEKAHTGSDEKVCPLVQVVDEKPDLQVVDEKPD